MCIRCHLRTSPTVREERDVQQHHGQWPNCYSTMANGRCSATATNGYKFSSTTLHNINNITHHHHQLSLSVESRSRYDLRSIDCWYLVQARNATQERLFAVVAVRQRAQVLPRQNAHGNAAAAKVDRIVIAVKRA